MGYLIKSTPEMGEYTVEVRKESFYICGEDSYHSPQRHAIYLYRSAGPDISHCQGTAEILIEDIPKIRACLDEIEKLVKERK